MQRTVLVTGSAGLIGSAVAEHFLGQGWRVIGIDNNMRANLFGPQGDNSRTIEYLTDLGWNYTHVRQDIRDRDALVQVFRDFKPDAVVHSAAQPSHDLAASRPYDDFSINAEGTLNLLEATRQVTQESPFVFLSTNKVYGDRPNSLPMVELAKRYDYAGELRNHGVNESMSIDQSTHSLFGVSKAAADLLVQEYGRYFNMPTTVLRGGCLTGSRHSGVPLHGFLSYMARVVASRSAYTIIGYKGKQVRDQIDAFDVAKIIELIVNDPCSGEVFNVGGGPENAASLRELLELVALASGSSIQTSYEPKPRVGDHICYYTDLRKITARYKDFPRLKPLPTIVEDVVRAAHDDIGSKK